MKKLIIVTLITSLFLTIGGANTKAMPFFKKQEKVADYASENKEENYKFPLDTYSHTQSIFDYDQNDFYQINNLKESTIEKSSAKAENDKFSRSIELSSDTVDFFTETQQYIAKGNATLKIPDEKMQLNAREIIIDQRNFEIIGIGNVKLTKDTIDYYGDYIRINTKKESSFFSNPILYYSEITITAKTATMFANETIVNNGSAIFKKDAKTIISSSSFGGLIASKLFKPAQQFESTEDKYKLKAKNIIVKRENNRSEITLKKATIYRGDKKIGYSPVFSIATDEDVNYVETIFPEIGSHSRIGTYIAPAVVFGLPNASTLKAGPLLAHSSSKDFGIGGFARLNTPKSRSDFMYASAKDKFVADIAYRLTDNLKFNFVLNEHLNTGWMGGQMPNYGAELSYEKNSFVSQANLSLRNRFAFGIYEDDKDYKKDPLTTARYQWSAEAYNYSPLLAWEKYLMLGYVYQHSFNLYQTGETMGVLRAGPRIYTDLGRLFAEITYFAGAQLNESPYIFDRYRYGKNNLRFRGQYYINKYLSLGYYASVNISEKDYEGNWLTENQFIAAVGTDDLKLRIGFDTVRNSSIIGFDMLLGANKTLIEFDEMKITNTDVKAKKSKPKKEKTKL